MAALDQSDYRINSIQFSSPIDIWNTTANPAKQYTYRFGVTDNQGWGFSGWTPFTEAEKVAMRGVLAEFESVANVRFTEVGTNVDATFDFAHVDLGWSGGQGGYTYSYSGTTILDYDGYALFSNDQNLALANARNLLLHEVGHALTLKHSGDYPNDAGSSGPFLPAGEENNKYTVMSYVNNPDNGQDSDHLMIYDIAALQARFGANMAYRTGNDTYTGPSGLIQAIWDAGGTDTIDASTYNGARVDLREGAYSSLGATNNLAIAFGAVIENARGGAGVDVLIGNDSANALYGGGGADNLSGEGGHDILYGGLGGDRLDGGAGFDYARYDDAAYGDIKVSLLNAANAVLGTGAAAGDIFFGIEGLILGSGNDWIYGNGGANYLYGQGGNDNIFGSLGADYIHGGTGFDYARFDDASYSGLQADLAGINQNTGAAAGDVFVDIEGLILTGNNDFGYGNSLSNYLYGLGGNDYLDGRTGQDFLFGGTGNDTFVMRAGYGRDTVGDFHGGAGIVDTIDLRGVYTNFQSVLGACTQVGSDLEIRLNVADVLVVKNFNLSSLVSDDVIL